MPQWDEDWFARLDRELIDLAFQPPASRRAVRRALAADPLAFAIIYLPHHLRDGDGPISFSEMHLDWCRIAESWRTPVEDPRQDRKAIIAPREAGKSTWWFLILPLWAAANEHVRFAVAFAHATGQAEGHLSTMKGELDSNILLRTDYPALCSPARRPSGHQIADRQGMLHTAAGFVFAARGIDSAVLGMKVQATRPDLLILDDIEPDEANYSQDQVIKRLGTVTDAVLPLGIKARTVAIGTVTMPGSIMHQLVKHTSGVEHFDWVSDAGFVARHYRAIVQDEQGDERSAWPSKWPMTFLQQIRHTRSYAKNYDNDPMARDGVYWQREDFQYGTWPADTIHGLFVDPAVTEKRSSDFTGLAVVGVQPAPAGSTRRIDRRVTVHRAAGVHLTGSRLRELAVRWLADDPKIKFVMVEVNQGGDLWRDVLHSLPVKVLTHTVQVPKEVRFADALDHYQRGRVKHAQRIPALEEQQVAFPLMKVDDIADAAVAGVLHWLSPDAKLSARRSGRSYVGSAP